jgi:hypothetical protein
MWLGRVGLNWNVFWYRGHNFGHNFNAGISRKSREIEKKGFLKWKPFLICLCPLAFANT